jgi:segregation and condensation protein A
MSVYQVKLPVFEGPFDLLFHLIEEQKVSIYDIPIATITAQYLDYLHMMEILDMEVASSFLIMAATLLEIKSRMLLPKAEPEMLLDGMDGEDGLDGEDARQQLVAQLLEYKRFKLVALELRELERRASRIYSRSVHYEPQPQEVLNIHLGPGELLDLYQGLVRRHLHPPVHKVVMDRINLNEKITQIRQLIRQGRGRLTFADLMKNRTGRLEMVLSFLAILEMAKAGELRIKQQGNFNSILLNTPEEDDEDEKSETTAIPEVAAAGG